MAGSLGIGLALGSGGARGLAHAGVLEALHEEGVPIDYVAGTSMGSIVGGLYAQKPDPADVWKRLGAYVDNEDFASYWAPFVPRNGADESDPHNRLTSIFDFMQRKMIAVKTVTRPYMQEEAKLRGPLGELFGPAGFDELAIPFAAVALDLRSGDPEIFSTGTLVDGIYASSCIPAVFPPVQRDGKLLVDGGGPYRVPVEAVRELGADLVIAVDIPAFEETKFATGMDMILRSNTIARQRLNRFVCATADFVITPDVTEFHWADFSAGEACRARGYKAARDAMPELLKLIRWRGSLGYKAKRLARRALRMG